MALTPEQIEEVKKQIFEQTKSFPEDRKKQIEEQINSMTPEELEEFVKQQTGGQQSQEIYRSIISGDIPAKKVGENPKAIAVLDIKPISKGHVVIIPKSQAKKSNKIPAEAFELGKELSDKIISELKAEGTEIQTEFKFGEMIINIIPIYDKALNINSPRYEAKEEELTEVYKKIKTEKKTEVIKQTTKPKKTKAIKLKRRVP